jgi:hypothetical protein
MEKIKNTKLGDWLKDKAPKVLELVGDSLPDSGVLGIVKNLIDSESKDQAFELAMADAEQMAQGHVTERWKADMSSDNTIAKAVRPVTLIALLGIYILLAITDSVDAIAFDVKDEYISLLQALSMTAFGAYFAGRSYEKVKR